MAYVFAVLALAAGTIWLEAPGLVRRQQFRELVIFLVLLSAGTVLYSVLVLQITLPNPFMLVKWMFGWTTKVKSF